MSLTIKVIQNGVNDTGILTNEANQKQAANKGKSIFAGNLGLNSETDSLIEQKRQSARKQAMKLVSDAWGKDQKAAQKIDDMRELRKDKLSKIEDSQAVISDINEAKERLQQEYNIDPDSQEQKDLELLERFQDYLKGVGSSEFTEEEVERLRELQNMPMTEYQVEVLKLNGEAGTEKQNIEDMEWQATILKTSISNAKLEQLKSQDMLNANEAAEELMDAASEEIINFLIQDSKDNIDEKVEEEQKKAEEIQEKKEEQQEHIDEAKEKRKEQEEIIKGDMEADKLELETDLKQQSTGGMESVQKGIQKIIKENKLVNEDLKGIEIDFNF